MSRPHKGLTLNTNRVQTKVFFLKSKKDFVISTMMHFINKQVTSFPSNTIKKQCWLNGRETDWKLLLARIFWTNDMQMKNKTRYRIPKEGGGRGSLEPWSTEMFVMKPGAQTLSWLGAPTKIVFLVKRSAGVKQWSLKSSEFSISKPCIF